MPSLSQVKVTDLFHRLVSKPALPPCPPSLWPLNCFCPRGYGLKWVCQAGQGSLTATQPGLYHLSPSRDPCLCSQPRIGGSW